MTTIDAALLVDGRRVPVTIVSTSRAWSVVRAVRTQFDNAHRLLVGDRKISTSRLCAVTDGDRFWWRTYADLSSVRTVAALTNETTTMVRP